MNQDTIYAMGEVLLSALILIGSFVIIALTYNSQQFATILPVCAGLDTGVITFWFTGRIHSNEAQATQKLITTMNLPKSTN